MIKEKIKP